MLFATAKEIWILSIAILVVGDFVQSAPPHPVNTVKFGTRLQKRIRLGPADILRMSRSRPNVSEISVPIVNSERIQSNELDIPHENDDEHNFDEQVEYTDDSWNDEEVDAQQPQSSSSTTTTTTTTTTKRPKRRTRPTPSVAQLQENIRTNITVEIMNLSTSTTSTTRTRRTRRPRPTPPMDKDENGNGPLADEELMTTTTTTSTTQRPRRTRRTRSTTSTSTTVIPVSEASQDDEFIDELEEEEYQDEHEHEYAIEVVPSSTTAAPTTTTTMATTKRTRRTRRTRKPILNDPKDEDAESSTTTKRPRRTRTPRPSATMSTAQTPSTTIHHQDEYYEVELSEGIEVIKPSTTTVPPSTTALTTTRRTRRTRTPRPSSGGKNIAEIDSEVADPTATESPATTELSLSSTSRRPDSSPTKALDSESIAPTTNANVEFTATDDADDKSTNIKIDSVSNVINSTTEAVTPSSSSSSRPSPPIPANEAEITTNQNEPMHQDITTIDSKTDESSTTVIEALNRSDGPTDSPLSSPVPSDDVNQTNSSDELIAATTDINSQMTTLA